MKFEKCFVCKKKFLLKGIGRHLKKHGYKIIYVQQIAIGDNKVRMEDMKRQILMEELSKQKKKK